MPLSEGTAMGNHSDYALRHRNYAEVLRLIAADKTTAEMRRLLHKLAEDYDRMAESEENVASKAQMNGFARSHG